MSSIEPCETCGYPYEKLDKACVDCLTRIIDPDVRSLIRERHAALRERLRAAVELLQREGFACASCGLLMPDKTAGFTAASRSGRVVCSRDCYEAEKAKTKSQEASK